MSSDTTTLPSARLAGIPGMVVIDLDVVLDGRGWSKTTFDLDLADRLHLPESFRPTRWCMNSNIKAGVTKGIHAEMCDKLVTSSRGDFHAVIVDLRRGLTFGVKEMVSLTPSVAIFVPIGCGNSYQTQTPDAQYNYVATRVRATAGPLAVVSLSDPQLAIEWPIPLTDAIIMEEDQDKQVLAEITPIDLGTITPATTERR